MLEDLDHPSDHVVDLALSFPHAFPACAVNSLLSPGIRQGGRFVWLCSDASTLRWGSTCWSQLPWGGGSWHLTAQSWWSSPACHTWASNRGSNNWFHSTEMLLKCGESYWSFKKCVGLLPWARCVNAEVIPTSSCRTRIAGSTSHSCALILS